MKTSLEECRAYAEDHGFDSMPFKLCGPAACLNAKWLDAYMGIFGLEGQNGFLMVRDFPWGTHDVWCEYEPQKSTREEEGND